jgi:hypothetical protein
MDTPHGVPELSPAPGLDSGPIRSAPWLTPRRLTLFVIGWLVLFALLSAVVSNPFQSEPNAGATPDYAHVMFMHGLLIGMVGLLALLTCQVLQLRSLHVRVWITGGVLVATILSALGGIWDTKIPGAEVAMWTQIFSFFALDEILATLLIGLIVEWRTARTARSLPYVAAFLASASMLAAALMGHLAGWIMEFGWTFPTRIRDFATFAGFGAQADFVAALVGSHSHEMTVGAMALTILLVAQQFGYPALTGAARALSRVGVALLGVGTIVMTGMYVAAALTQWAPPAWFVSGPQGVNGIASDDVITGILVMGGGVVIAVALMVGRTGLFRQPVRLAAVWAWVLSFATVVVAGYAIEMNTAFFGAGDQGAKGAANDAVFTWLHQDIGLFLFPALVLVMLATERLVNKGHPGLIGWLTIAGTTVTFVGGMLYVFVDTATYGIGYTTTTLGLLVVGIALLATLWWGVASDAGPAALEVTPPAPQRTAPLWEPGAHVPSGQPIPGEPAEAPERTPVAVR